MIIIIGSGWSVIAVILLTNKHVGDVEGEGGGGVVRRDEVGKIEMRGRNEKRST